MLIRVPPFRGRLVVIVGALMAMIIVLVATFMPGVRGSIEPGSPLAATRIDTDDITVDITYLPAKPAAGNTVAQQLLVGAVLSDLEVFGKQQLTSLTDQPITGLAGGLLSVDSVSLTGSAACVVASGQLVGNAFYCASTDEIVYDRATLVPVILENYGAPGLMAAFAHEFGHAIQARIGPTSADRAQRPDEFPSLLIEAQGDCYAGAFLAWAAEGNAARSHLSADSIGLALGPMMDFADPITLNPADPTAHGLAIDRLTWVSIGYSGGSSSCAAMTMSTMPHVRSQGSGAPADFPRTDTPRFASQAAVESAAKTSISSFTSIAPHHSLGPSQDIAQLAKYGQFAQATAIAVEAGEQWAYETGAKQLAVHGADDRAAPVSPQAACFAGAWAADTIEHADPDTLGSWPRDPDEGLAAVRYLTGAHYGTLVAFSNGFHHGLDRCRL